MKIMHKNQPENTNLILLQHPIIISESLETLGIKILKLFDAVPDPGSRIF
jgi:hypothetical protein